MTESQSFPNNEYFQYLPTEYLFQLFCRPKHACAARAYCASHALPLALP